MFKLLNFDFVVNVIILIKISEILANKLSV